MATLLTVPHFDQFMMRSVPNLKVPTIKPRKKEVPTSPTVGDVHLAIDVGSAMDSPVLPTSRDNAFRGTLCITFAPSESGVSLVIDVRPVVVSLNGTPVPRGTMGTTTDIFDDALPPNSPTTWRRARSGMPPRSLR